MKGFIEVTSKEHGTKFLVNISLIKRISEYSTICFENEHFYTVKESYEEIKQLIKTSHL